MLDFTLLPMTELRTRPGEILDRVADNGEAFLIERNGQRRACLVPITVFLPDISPARIANEIDELEKSGESPQTTVTNEKEIAFHFQCGDATAPINMTVVLPNGYPNACPRIYATPIDEKTPHRWADGALCVFGVLSAWNPGQDTVASALRLGRTWVKRYSEWKSTGQWPVAGDER